MRNFTYPRSKYNEKNIDKDIIKKLIGQHKEDVTRLENLKRYYLGEHDILTKKRLKNQPNFKPICNHAKDITDTATGYFMGNVITYNSTDGTDIDSLLVAFDTAEVNEQDYDNALNMSIYGVAYEYVYIVEGTNDLNIKELEPQNTFLVYDDSIEQKPLFAVYYYELIDDTISLTKNCVNIFTENLIYNFILEEKITEPTQHNMGAIPVVEFRNNKFCIGDFEQQIGLIDSYNELMADRVNDKEQFINSVLVLYGAQLATDEEETIKAIQALRSEGLLEMPLDAKAEYIARTLDENAVETLKKSLKNDIYTFSHVPNLTDENFAGNSSGVAMEYKLLGLEIITKTKQRYYIKGLKQRIKLFCNYLGFSQIKLNVNSIVPQFSRGLPKNILELSQIISNLQGKVTLRKLIALLPFVEDPDAEIEGINKEKQENIQNAQLMINNTEINSYKELGEDEE